MYIKTPSSTPPPSYSNDEGAGRQKSAPTPRHTYIIQSAVDGRQLTLVDGRIVLTKKGNLGSPYWSCVETYSSIGGGMMGFRNKASGKLLGHDGTDPGRLVCVAERHQAWEYIQVIQSATASGAFTMYSEYNWQGFRPIELAVDGGETMLQRSREFQESNIAWYFIEVA